MDKQEFIIHQATIVNEGHSFEGSIYVRNGRIEKIIPGAWNESFPEGVKLIEAQGSYLLPGVIDDQVHFRDPGLTHKGDMVTESRAAVAGGITSFMEMPNTNPQTTTLERLEEKYQRASQVSLANYSFYMGATNDNIEEVLKVDPRKVCGVKVFMGSSTGNMLVDKEETLSQIFKEVPLLIATHCEDEATIQANSAQFKERFGEQVPIKYHPEIRSREACYKSSSYAVGLARKYGARLHVLHLSTKEEISLFEKDVPLDQKRVTGEVCVHHLWFDDRDYEKYGARMKWNPAVKKESDKEALLAALISGQLDVIATDHAPHLPSEKEGGCFQAASGGPLVQHSLQVMLELVKQGKITIEKVVEKMCHAPALLFGVENRGFIRQGYAADLVLVNPKQGEVVGPDNILYKCGWSPFDGMTFSNKVTHTFVNGHLAFKKGQFDESLMGERLSFKPRR